MTCQYQTRPAGKDTGRRLCALNWASGRPYVGECQKCITAARNTPEAYAAALALAQTSHPPDAEPCSGCCDRADQF
jgi:hypothetical protein